MLIFIYRNVYFTDPRFWYRKWNQIYNSAHVIFETKLKNKVNEAKTQSSVPRVALFEFGIKCRTFRNSVFVYTHETWTRRAALRTRPVLRDSARYYYRYATRPLVSLAFCLRGRSSVAIATMRVIHTYWMNRRFRHDFVNIALSNII